MNPTCHAKLKPIFQKKVKTKKRHEIELMAQLCHQSCQNYKVDFVIDFGAGIGHLARLLNYGYNIPVCCLEKEERLNRQASELDQKIETAFQRYWNQSQGHGKSSLRRPFHLTLTLDSKLTIGKFLNLLKECLLEQKEHNLCNKIEQFQLTGDDSLQHKQGNSFDQYKINEQNKEKLMVYKPEIANRDNYNNLQHLNETDLHKRSECGEEEHQDKNYGVQFPFTFGIIGLHPCGDLAAILISLFLRIPQARFLHLVGCCYMKLTTNVVPKNLSQDQSKQSLLLSNGYPLSKYLNCNMQSVGLSSEAREVACHAIEMYYDRLTNRNYEFLKIHSFRAATERILVNRYPHLKHSGLRNVRYVSGLSFEEYFQRAVADLDIPSFRSEDLCQPTTQEDLQRWRELVIFYSLRLFFAPLIESVILYDRILYLMENGETF